LFDGYFGGATGDAFTGNSDVGSIAAQIVLLHSVGMEKTGFNTPSWSISTEFYAYILFVAVILFVNINRYILFGAVLAKRDAWARIAGCMREEAGSVVGSVIV